jgi:bacterioferritin
MVERFGLQRRDFMDRQEFIAMLNQDLADEHASVLRYLIHAYQVGEDTPLGQMLLSTAREEMWHMNWLGDEIGERGEEPDMVKADFPYEGTSNAALLRSYIAWEDNLVGVYEQQAAMVEDRELKRILQQLGWESITHRRRFQAWLDKLGPEGEKPLEFEGPGFSADVLRRFHGEVDEHYKLVLQHLRHAFIFEDPACPIGSELELSAFRHMKHMSHFAEELAEYGEPLDFEYPGVDTSRSLKPALQSDLELTQETRDRLIALGQNPEVADNQDLKIEIDTVVTRNGLLSTVLHELIEAVDEGSPEIRTGPLPSPQVTEPGTTAVEAPPSITVKPETSETPAPKPKTMEPAHRFTVGSLKGS